MKAVIALVLLTQLLTSVSVASDGGGLIYLHSRYLDPNTGHMLTPDPLSNRQLNGATNRYSYSGNSPATYSDPSGLVWWNTVLIGISNGLRSLRTWAYGKPPATSFELANYDFDWVHKMANANELAQAKRAELVQWGLESGGQDLHNQALILAECAKVAEGCAVIAKRLNGLDDSVHPVYAANVKKQAAREADQLETALAWIQSQAPISTRIWITENPIVKAYWDIMAKAGVSRWGWLGTPRFPRRPALLSFLILPGTNWVNDYVKRYQAQTPNNRPTQFPNAGITTLQEKHIQIEPPPYEPDELDRCRQLSSIAC